MYYKFLKVIYVYWILIIKFELKERVILPQENCLLSQLDEKRKVFTGMLRELTELEKMPQFKENRGSDCKYFFLQITPCALKGFSDS